MKNVFFTFESMGNWIKIMKNTFFWSFFESFFKNENRLHSAIVTLHSKWRNSESRSQIYLDYAESWLNKIEYQIKKEVWVSGRNRYSAKVLDLVGLEGSNPSASARFGSLAQLDQSTTLRTSGSGVRISHESQTMEVWQSWSIALVLKTSRR